MLLHRRKSFRGGGATPNGLLNGLVSCWEMDSDATDEHSTNDGTATNITWDTTTKKLGTASGDYNGSTSRIAVPDDNSLDFGTSDFTIAMWLYADVQNGYVANKRDNRLAVSPGRVIRGDGFVRISDSSAQVSSSVGYVTDTETWYLMIVEFDRDDTFKIYRDGSTLLFTSASIASIGNVNNAREVDFGTRYNNGSYESFWNGRIDQVCMRNELLGTDRRNALYNSGDGLPYSSFTT